MADVPNVLIIGDGFLAAERPAFDALANKLVAEIYANSRLAPFGLLKDRLNFFRTMVPSGEVSSACRTGTPSTASPRASARSPMPFTPT